MNRRAMLIVGLFSSVEGCANEADETGDVMHFIEASGTSGGSADRPTDLTESRHQHTNILSPTADAWIDTRQSSNYGTAAELDVGFNGGNKRQRALLLFDETALVAAASSDLISATLHFEITSGPDGFDPPGEIAAHQLTQGFEELGVTWWCSNDLDLTDDRQNCSGGTSWGSNGGSFAATASDVAPVVPGGATSIDFDVTQDVQDFLGAASGEELGWAIVAGTSAHGGVSFGSNNSANAPTLVLVFEHELPPDPTEVAPEIDSTASVSFGDRVRFLYEGPQPVQVGVAPGTMEPGRVGVIRGRVLDEAGDPLPAAAVTIKDHPEFGSTESRVDGWFDLAVNGGSSIVVEFRAGSRIPAQRTIEVGWQDFALVNDVVLFERDSAVTRIDFVDPFEVALGSPVADVDGTRQAALFFEQNTVATMHLPGGGTPVLPTIHVRATEATVGGLGRQRMQGDLPPASMYGYAVDYSIDEAESAGANHVSFDPPAIAYTPNFVGTQIGAVVPSGYYDMERAAWVPQPDGVALEVVWENFGLAHLDLDGDGISESQTDYIAAGITQAERQKIAELYEPGDELWRVEVEHFSSWDYNHGWAPVPTAEPPPEEGPQSPQPDSGSCKTSGSIIGCQSQVLGEQIDVTGTPFFLAYSSDRVPGRTASYTLSLPVTGDAPPAELQGVKIRTRVAGRGIDADLPPSPGQEYSVTWDGLDPYGRRLQGPAHADLCLGYSYGVVLQSTLAMSGGGGGGGGGGSGSFGSFGFNGNGTLITGGRDGNDVTFWRCFAQAPVGGGVVPASPGTAQKALGWSDGYQLGVWDARAGAAALGGWTLSVHHTLAAEVGTVFLGDGGRLTDAETYNSVIQTVAGGGGSGAMDIPATQAQLNHPQSVVMGADGSLYVSLASQYVRRISPDGVIEEFAGQLGAPLGDGGPATDASLASPHGLAVGPDGSVYIADFGHRRVRRVDPSGTITTVAGNGGVGARVDGQLAVNTPLGSAPIDVEIAPDGTLYVLVQGSHAEVLRVTPDGVMTTFAGATCTAGAAEGKIATEDCLENVGGFTRDQYGAIYITGSENPGLAPDRVYRIGSNNRYEVVAGGGSPFDGVGDGLLATDANLENIHGIDLSADGAIYVAQQAPVRRVRIIGTDGYVSTLAGNDNCCDIGDDGPAPAAYLSAPMDVVVGYDHAVYVSDHTYNPGRVRRISAAGLGFSPDGRIVASKKHKEIYVFSADGRHESTLDARTGLPIWTFGYVDGRLETIQDGLGGTPTTIIRNASGEATSIVSPDGHVTSLDIPIGGYLSGITNPEGEAHTFNYSSDGLLESRTTPRSQTHTYGYDSGGRLVLATDPDGNEKSFVRTNLGPAEYEVTMTTELGRQSNFSVSRLPDGALLKSNTYPDGSSSQELTSRDGTTAVTFFDGTTVVSEVDPDPRFGMQSPLRTTTTTTPAGLQRVEARTRDVTLLDEDDPLSVVQITETYSLNNRTWTAVYDAASGSVVLTTPEGRTSTRTFDEYGNVSSFQYANLDLIDVSRDAQGRVDAIEHGDGGSTRTISPSYGADGFMSGLVDALGQTHSFVYDGAGRLTDETRPDSVVISRAYDGDGNVESWTPPSQPQHVFGFNSIGQVSSYVPPVTPEVPLPATTYVYSMDHELEVVTRPDGQVVDIVYEPLTGRVDYVSTPGGDYDFTYDPQGHIEVITDPDLGSLTYAYDGSLTTSEVMAGEVAGTVTWTYGDDYSVASESVNGGSTIAFGYDLDGVLTTAGAETLTPDPATGLFASVSLDASTTTFVHDGFGELESISHSVGGVASFDATYTRDSLGRISSMTETVEGVSRDVAYGYDLAGRLETVTEDGVLIASYSYDDNGNRTLETTTGGTFAATYDAQDRLQTYGNLEISHGLNGEVSSVFNTVTLETTDYTYDVMGNLRQVVLPGSTTIEYVTDALDRRVGRKVGGVVDKGWLYSDQLQIIAELDSAGALVSRFVYGSRQYAPDYMVANGNTYRLVTDNIGSVRLVVDSTTGAVVQRIDYDPWGQVLLDTNPGFQPFGFAGGLYDPDTGLVRFGARDYDPRFGRWLSKDPILFGGGGPNLYQYSLNDPINLIDPTGNIPLAIPAAGALAGLTAGEIAGALGLGTALACVFSGACLFPEDWFAPVCEPIGRAITRPLYRMPKVRRNKKKKYWCDATCSTAKKGTAREAGKPVMGGSDRNCSEATLRAKDLTPPGFHPHHCRCKDNRGFIGKGHQCESHL